MCLVSVIIPNYNHRPFLKRRIESVLNQTYTDIEIIILDDCSTDNSKAVINEFLHHSKVAHFIRNVKNSGNPFAQWNKGIELATGDLIWIAESDDEASPDFLSTVIKPLIESENIVLSYCQSNRMNAEGHITGNWIGWTDKLQSGALFHDHFAMNGKSFIERFLIFQNVIPNASAVVFRKKIYQELGGADTEICHCADWLTWLKMLTSGDVHYCAQALNNYRYHSESVINSALHRNDFKKKHDIIMRKALSNFFNSTQISEQIIKQNMSLRRQEITFEAFYMLRQQKYSKALKYFLMSFLPIT